MSDDIKKGLLGIVVDETTISQVMPDINSLTYRGYAVQDLCEMCNFEEVAYLILQGNLPNSIQLNKFRKEERENRRFLFKMFNIINDLKIVYEDYWKNFNEINHSMIQLLSTDYKFAISFSILVIVLLFRPSGIFEGKKI